MTQEHYVGKPEIVSRDNENFPFKRTIRVQGKILCIAEGADTATAEDNAKRICETYNGSDQLKDINRELLEALTECLGEWGRKFPGLKEEPWLDTQFQNLTQLVTKAQSLNL